MKPQGSKRDEAFLTGGRIRSEMPRLAICTTGLYRHTVERLNVGIIGRLTGPRESQHDLVGICPGEARSKECLNWEGQRCRSVSIIRAMGSRRHLGHL